MSRLVWVITLGLTLGNPFFDWTALFGGNGGKVDGAKYGSIWDPDGDKANYGSIWDPNGAPNEGGEDPTGATTVSGTLQDPSGGGEYGSHWDPNG